MGPFLCSFLTMTIAEVLEQVKNPDTLGVEVLLAHVLGLRKEDLFAHPERSVSDELLVRFRDLFERLNAGEPVAYLTGRKEFYGLEFFVDRSVLIPRPETELLVDKVREYVGEQPLRILDVGTGCGAIAVALAKRLPHARVTGTDISADALRIAWRNAITHGVDVEFLQTDLLERIDERFDVVVANLPYIGKKKFNFISQESEQFEPHVALFGGIDGLELYRCFFEQLREKSWKPQLLVGEFGFLQGEAMDQLLNKNFEQQDWRIEKDYASIERIFVVTFSNDD